MNEQTKQFIEFINNGSIYRMIRNELGDAFYIALAIALFNESKKRRMNEGENDLSLDCARSLVEEYREDFDKHRSECNPRFYYQWRQQDYEGMAREIAEHIEDNHSFKRIVASFLRDFRNEMFDEVAYKNYLVGFVIEENPMQTFVFWLDYIENLKGLPEYQNWLALKRNLVNFTRVGNSTFRRCEWQNKISKVEEQPRAKQ